MNQQYDRLKALLSELFQLDQPELDFGFYRIMHAKADELTRFLEHDLLPQVRKAFELYRPADKVELEAQLAKAIEQARGLGAEPDTIPKVIELRNMVATATVDVRALEQEVFDHLFRFFRRYYSEGDFLAKRVYKPGVYAIPYEGEEVVLYWANRDQYYIKSSQYLRDYTFRLRPEDATNSMSVHFRLVDVAEGEHGDVKAVNGKERVFIIRSENYIAEEDGELYIDFEYRPTTLDDWPSALREGRLQPPNQKDAMFIGAKRILANEDGPLAVWISELAKPSVRSSGEEAEYSKLEAQLRRYTARNSFDYFIHKDLGSFLRRELDFYIKNEVMHLDDVQYESAPRVDQYLSKIKVLRRTAGKIIDFLAQLEDFQRKLWLKKKFVIQTDYCIALKQIPEQFYPDIIASNAQRQEWVRLLAIDRIEGNGTTSPYSVPLTEEFLKAHPTLMVDTHNLTAEACDRLLHALPNIDDQLDGVLIQGENFQALGLLARRYSNQVKCIYIDPPYNTDASAIDYKNGYKASSWMSLMEGRIASSRFLLQDDGVLVAAIDDEQQRELNFILSDIFGRPLLGTICVRANPSGRPTKTGYSVAHEYLLFVGASAQSAIGRMPPTREQLARFSQHDEEGPFEWRNLRREGSNSDRVARRALYYPIYLSGDAIRVPNMTWNSQSTEWIVGEPPLSTEQVVWPDNDQGTQKTWRWEWATVMASLRELSVRKDRGGRDYVYYKRRPNEEGVVSVSTWFDAKYSSTEHGTALLKAMFGRSPFSYPKSIYAVLDAIYVAGASKADALVLDYFAGSGTTGHAVIKLNREDGGRRKFILVEMGEYFDTVLLPRIKKVSFTPEWKDGQPEGMPTSQEAERSPRILKVIRLESYEDALNNLDLRRSIVQQSLLDVAEAQGVDGLREKYTLNYMLDVETSGSQSLLNVQAFADPTAYALKIRPPGGDESREVRVDLLETFNWLIGLSVQHIAGRLSFRAQFYRDSENRLRLKGDLEQGDKGPWWFRTVTGITPDGRRALVIWRKLTGVPEEDNLVLDEWFKKHWGPDQQNELQLIYVNGDNNLENVRTLDQTWKVRLIEEDFHRLMFETR